MASSVVVAWGVKALGLRVADGAATPGVTSGARQAGESECCTTTGMPASLSTRTYSMLHIDVR